jgi:hypothetical protein
VLQRRILKIFSEPEKFGLYDLHCTNVLGNFEILKEKDHFMFNQLNLLELRWDE